jgi:hypothetical protein
MGHGNGTRARRPEEEESYRRELDRRTAAFAQARRIEEYLPTLERQIFDAERELEELRQHYRDEVATARRLNAEGSNRLAYVEARERKKAERQLLQLVGTERRR